MKIEVGVISVPGQLDIEARIWNGMDGDANLIAVNSSYAGDGEAHHILSN